MSVRSPFTAGLCAVAAGIIAIPAVVSPPAPTASLESTAAARTMAPVALASSVRMLAADPPDPRQLATAVGAIERLDPVLAQAASTRRSALAAAVRADDDPAAVAPAPLNAASDWITSGYQFIQSWVQYGVSLATYVLQFIPYGYLISSQINIVYYNLVQPIADSVVYGLINPVVNDPLNLATYVNGFLTVGAATVNALINTGIAEFNYFFGWLIPPIPPIPLSVAATTEPDPSTAAPNVEPEASERMAATFTGLTPKALGTDETTEPTKALGPADVAGPAETPADADVTGPTETPAETTDPGTTGDPIVAAPVLTETPVTETPVAETPAVTETPATTGTPTAPVGAPVKKPVETEPTTTSLNGVQAQGEVRGGTVATPTGSGATTPGTGATGKGQTDPTPGTVPTTTATNSGPGTAPGEPSAVTDDTAKDTKKTTAN